MSDCEPTADVEARLLWAVEIARRAGRATLGWFREPDLTVERKGDGSPVTAADQAAEKLLREAISHRYPDDAIVGEEFGKSSGVSRFQWTIDPIDGTKAFVAGAPLYTTLVGVLQDGESVAGVVHAPATDEIVYAAASGPCRYAVGDSPPREARVSAVESLADALFVTTSVNSYDKFRGSGTRAVYERLEAACRLTRTWGDAYGYLLVATGRADVMVDPAMSIWDTAPLKPVIEAAGGRFSDWTGAASIHSEEAVATNGLLHENVLEALAGA